MRLLAIDCATEACSVALFEDGALLDARHEVLGRGHAERLVPMIAELPERGRAEEIRVGLGPGSFTGARIGLAAARALGIAWGARVLGFPTLALLAATARRECNTPVSVCIAGGHGEWLVQDFDSQGMPLGPHVSVLPEDAAMRPSNKAIAGNKARERAALDGSGHVVLEILPDARCALEVPDSLLTPDLKPIYARPPDARLPA